MKESHTRSLLKALTWRIIATTTILIVSYVTTGSIKTALAIGSIDFFVKLALYYLHERAWQQAPRGSVREMAKKIIPENTFLYRFLAKITRKKKHE